MANLPKVQSITILTCKECHRSFLAEMPLIDKVTEIKCEACESLIMMNKNECCVYCSHGSEKCPKMQIWDMIERTMSKA